MPSRFLTLWTMLAKPASHQQAPGKKKNKKDTSVTQVRYRPGYAPVIPIYGEDEEAAPSVSEEVLLPARKKDEPNAAEVQTGSSSSALLGRSGSVFRRSHFFRHKAATASATGNNRNHQSVDSLAVSRRPEASSRISAASSTSTITNSTISPVRTKSLSVGGLNHRSSLRVCQAKRVAPPIVPDCGTGQQQHHRHSGSSFDSTVGSISSAESTASGSGGYCSGSTGGGSVTWNSQVGLDQRNSIGLDDPFTSLPPPPASPAAHLPVANKHHHMYKGESEPLYSGRNPGSPSSFGGSAGIFTYPSSGNNSNGIYGQVGHHLQHTYRSSGGSQPGSPHVQAMESQQQQQQQRGDHNGVMAPGPTLLPHPNYSHQISLEDQGIDLTQSPGRESPSSSSSTVSVGLKSCNSGGSGTSSSVLLGLGSSGSGSSCRHSTTSTTSLDSGRASGTYDHHGHGQRLPHANLLVVHHQTTQQQRFSGQSYETCLRNSYHSSSSSLGSAGGCVKIDDIHRLNVCEMLSQGVPDHEILNAWLTDLGFEEYYDLFVQSGYDMHTITRMTPEDLTAIGIQKPNHRKKLKAEIALLRIPDGLPDFIPDTLEEWLALLGLAEYSPSLRRQGYRTVEDVTQLTWEDLEDFGILRLGHQKKITLAIKRVKDILAGKYVHPSPGHVEQNSFCSTEKQHEMSTFQYRTSTATTSSHYAIPPSVMRPVYFPPQQQQIYHHYQQQHILQQQQLQQQQQEVQQPVYYQYQQPTYQPDVVAIQVHRNRSSEDVRTFPGPAGSATTEPVQQQTFAYKPGWRQRSYEDGDVTPVSEQGHPLGQPSQGHVPGGGTLPRPRGTVKPRPVAKISAKTRSDCSDQDEPILKPSVANSNPQYGTLGKKNPPPAPPKRASSSSLTETPATESEPIYGRSAKSSPLPLPPPPPAVTSDPMSYSTYYDDSEDFPPPPAPITASDSYLQHHNGQHPGASAAASVRERLDNILQRSGAGHWPARPHQQHNSSHYGAPNVTANRTNGAVSSMKAVSARECSPSDSVDTSDTEPGSPAMEFRQRRNGSDASFKSTSSTESDSMPFANDNAGTIKQRSARTHPALAALTYSSHPGATVLSPSLARRATAAPNIGTSDVLNDIGNMLADLTDELDSMLEEETGSHQALRQKS